MQSKKTRLDLLGAQDIPAPCLGIRNLAPDDSTRACIFHHAKLTYWSEARVAPRRGQPP